MALDVGEVRATLKLSNEQWDRAVETTRTKTTSSVREIVGVLTGLEQSVRKIDAPLGQVQGGFDRATSSAKALAMAQIPTSTVKVLKDLGVSADDYAAALVGLPGAQKAVGEQIAASKGSADQLEAAYRGLATAGGNLATEAGAAGKAVGGTKDSIQAAGTAASGATTSLGAASTAAGGLNTALSNAGTAGSASLRDVAAAGDAAAGGAKDAAEALADVSDEAEKAGKSTADLVDSSDKTGVALGRTGQNALADGTLAAAASAAAASLAATADTASGVADSTDRVGQSASNAQESLSGIGTAASSGSITSTAALAAVAEATDDAAAASAKAAESASDQAAAQAEAAVTATDAAEAQKEVSKANDDTSESADKTGNAFTVMAGIIASAGIADYLRDAVNAGSDLNETMDLSGKVFGQAVDGVKEFASTAPQALGLSKGEALGAATSFGVMFTQIGYTKDAAAGLSTEVVKLSADLGSAFNRDTTEVVDSLTSAFRGEYDSIQALIPTINGASVEQEALATTGKKTADALTDGEKAAAVLAIAYRDGAIAQDNFAQTASGFANSQKSSTAAMRSQQEELGQRLLPVVQTFTNLLSQYGIPLLGTFGDVIGALAEASVPLAQALASVVTGVTELPAPVIAASVALGAVLLLSGPLATAGGAIVTAWGAVGSTIALQSALAGGAVGRLGATTAAASVLIQRAGVAIKTAFLSNLPLLALSALVAGVAAFSASGNDAEQETDEWRGKLADLKGTLDQTTGAVTDLTKTKVRELVGDEAIRNMESLGINTTDVLDAMLNVPGASDRAAASISAQGERAIEASQGFQKYGEQLAAAGVGINDLSRAFIEGGPAIEDLNGKLAGAGLSLADLGNGAFAVKNSLDGTSTAITDNASFLAYLRTVYGQTTVAGQELASGQEDLAAGNRAVAGSSKDATSATEDQTKAAKRGEDGSLLMSDAVKAQEVANKDLETAIRNVIAALDDQQHRNDPTSDYAAAAAIRDTAAAFRERDQSTRDVAQANADYQQSLADVETAQKDLTDAQSDGESTAADLAEKQRDLDEAHRGVAEAAAGVKDAEDDAAGSGQKLYEVGESVREAFVRQAQEAYNSAAATGTAGEAQLAAKKKTEELTARLRDQLAAQGLLPGEIDSYVASLGLVPSEVSTLVEAQGVDAAISKIDTIKRKMVDLNGTTSTLFIRASATSSAAATAAQGIVATYATGGEVRGPGTSTSDSIPALLSDDEHVLTAREVNALPGRHSDVYAIRRAMLAGTLSGYASGGEVTARRRFASGGAVTAGLGGQRGAGGGFSDSQVDRIVKALYDQPPRIVQIGENVSLGGGGADLRESLAQGLFGLRTVGR